jgi:hypothetical protein
VLRVAVGLAVSRSIPAALSPPAAVARGCRAGSRRSEFPNALADLAEPP